MVPLLLASSGPSSAGARKPVPEFVTRQWASIRGLPVRAGEAMVDWMSGMTTLVFSDAKSGIPSGGLGRDLGIIGIGRPARPLPDAVPLPREVVLGLPPQPHIGRAPASRF